MCRRSPAPTPPPALPPPGQRARSRPRRRARAARAQPRRRSDGGPDTRIHRRDPGPEPRAHPRGARGGQGGRARGRRPDHRVELAAGADQGHGGGQEAGAVHRRTRASSWPTSRSRRPTRSRSRPRRRSAERQKQFLERRQALHGAELDRAKAGKKLASAQQKALELELQLAERHADRSRVAGSDPTVTLRQDQVIRELERKTLEAQRQQADAAKDVAAPRRGHRQAAPGSLHGADGGRRQLSPRRAHDEGARREACPLVRFRPRSG